MYAPAVPRHTARKSALKHLVDTFFDGSAEQVVAAVLGGEGARLTEDDLKRIAELVTKARKEKKLFYEERFAELVAADEGFDGSEAAEQVLDFAILVDALS